MYRRKDGEKKERERDEGGVVEYNKKKAAKTQKTLRMLSHTDANGILAYPAIPLCQAKKKKHGEISLRHTIIIGPGCVAPRETKNVYFSYDKQKTPM